MAKKNPHAVALGRIGGKARVPKGVHLLPAERRSEIARKAALARWAKLSSAERSAVGRRAGRRGGRARAEKLTAAQRSEIARRAALARWAKAKKAGPKS